MVRGAYTTFLRVLTNLLEDFGRVYNVLLPAQLSSRPRFVGVESSHHNLPEVTWPIVRADWVRCNKHCKIRSAERKSGKGHNPIGSMGLVY